MPHRFYVDDPLTADLVELDEHESRHLRDVMRLKAADLVELFNGRGAVATAMISKVAKRCVQLQVQSRRTVDRSLPGVTIAAAVPKGERFRWMIEKLTELNVDRLIPLQTHRSVVSPGDTKLQRMRQIVISAAKQCGRNFLMTIDPLTEWRQVVDDCGANMMLADPNGQPPPTDSRGPATRVFAIGPEGGFTADESRLALDAGATPVCFAKTILRIETAAIAAAVVAGTMQAGNDD